MIRLPSFSLLTLSLALFLTGLACAQELEEGLAEVLEAAKTDPGGALDRLERYLGSTALGPHQRVAALQAKATLQSDLGRSQDAAATWSALAKRGVDVGRALLALRGAKLALAVDLLPAPDSTPTLTLSGERTGPLDLRLYQVDPSYLERPMPLGLFESLRAPPPSALTKLEAWRDPGFGAAGSRSVDLPRALACGTYLLALTAREVTQARPLVVTRLLPLARVGAAGGPLLVLDRQTGAPGANLELASFDAAGHPLGAQGRTSGQGLLHLPAGARWVLGRAGPELVLLPIPAAGPPPEPSPAVRIATDRPTHTPGQTVYVRTWAPPASSAPRALALVGPGGVTREIRTLEPDRSGVATAAVELPAFATPGDWTLRVDGDSAPLPVAPALAAPIELSAVAPAQWSGPDPLTVQVTAAMAVSGLPLGGDQVDWRLLATAAEEAGAAEGPRPLPRFALRGVGEPRELSRGALALDAQGAAELVIPWTPRGEPELLTLHLTLGGARVLAESTHTIAAGPSDLVLAIRPARRLSQAGSVVPVTLIAARLDGTPLPKVDLTVGVRRVRRDGSRLLLEERSLRTRGDGTARTTLSMGRAGFYEVEARAADAMKRSVRVRAPVWFADAQIPEARGDLELGFDPASGSALARFPFAQGVALATRERGDVLSAEVLPVRGGLARWEPARPGPPGCDVTVSALCAGEPRSASARWDTRPPGLRLRASAVSGGPGEQVVLTVHTADPEGAGRSARVDAVLHPEATAAALDRGVAVGILATSAVAPARWTNAKGAGRIRLTLPQVPGTYWARLTAVDSLGREARAWCQVRVKASVALVAAAPETLLEGDESLLALRVRCADPLAFFPGAVLRVSWRAKGLKVGQPRVLGSTVVLEGDPGSGTVRIEAAPEVRVLLPIVATARGDVEVTAAASLEEDPAPPTSVTRTVRVVESGIWTEKSWSGQAVGAEGERLRLDLPKGMREAMLHVTVDPEEATAALAALDALGADGLQAPLQSLLLRSSLARMTRARKLEPVGVVAPPALSEVIHRLADARDANKIWGDATVAVTLALLRLRAEGVEVPAALLDPAISHLKTSSDARAIAARALAKRPLDVPPNPSPAHLVYRALALESGGLAASARRDAIAVADRLEGARPRAELLGLLARTGDAKKTQEALAVELLLARRGPGWGDPAATGAAIQAFCQLASRRSESRGVRVRARLEGKNVFAGFSGDGLREWPLPGRALVRPRSRLEILAKSGERVAYAVLARGQVGQSAPLDRGLKLRLTIGGLRASQEPWIARVGQCLTLGVERSTGGLPERLRASWIELPLPTGGTLLEVPPGFRVYGQTLQGPLLRDSLTVRFLCQFPGKSSLAPARARSLERPEVWGCSGQAELIVVEAR